MSLDRFTDERSARRHPSVVSSDAHLDIRTPFRHDRDRILYSAEFRRLAQVTQVLSPEANRVAHNRLTHTLEVAQIGRSIAETLVHQHRENPELLELAGGLDPDVVEAAALAHDIGHPPFGHTTETVLNQLLSINGGDGGFEGNAQSFRVISKLAVHNHSYKGLNLTRATLAAMQKYPWLEGRQSVSSSKWGAYNSELPDLQFCREHLPREWRQVPQLPDTSLRTLEAEIMDWADDVAYAIHDVEDFYKAGNQIPLDRLHTDQAELDRFISYHSSRKPEYADLDSETAKLLFRSYSSIERPFSDGREDRIELRLFSSSLINRFILAPSLIPLSDSIRKWDMVIDETRRSEVRVLKSLLNFYVLDAPSLKSVRHGYVNLIKQLFDILFDVVDNGTSQHGVLPTYVRDWIDEGISSARVVADFIASMSDIQVISYYRRLTGMSFGDSFDVIV